jgi:hypothetical protein
MEAQAQAIAVLQSEVAAARNREKATEANTDATDAECAEWIRGVASLETRRIAGLDSLAAQAYATVHLYTIVLTESSPIVAEGRALDKLSLLLGEPALTRPTVMHVSKWAQPSNAERCMHELRRQVKGLADGTPMGGTAPSLWTASAKLNFLRTHTKIENCLFAWRQNSPTMAFALTKGLFTSLVNATFGSEIAPKMGASLNSGILLAAEWEVATVSAAATALAMEQRLEASRAATASAVAAAATCRVAAQYAAMAVARAGAHEVAAAALAVTAA